MLGQNIKKIFLLLVTIIIIDCSQVAKQSIKTASENISATLSNPNTKELLSALCKSISQKVQKNAKDNKESKTIDKTVTPINNLNAELLPPPTQTKIPLGSSNSTSIETTTLEPTPANPSKSVLSSLADIKKSSDQKIVTPPKSVVSDLSSLSKLINNVISPPKAATPTVVTPPAAKKNSATINSNQNTLVDPGSVVSKVVVSGLNPTPTININEQKMTQKERITIPDQKLPINNLSSSQIILIENSMPNPISISSPPVQPRKAPNSQIYALSLSKSAKTSLLENQALQTPLTPQSNTFYTPQPPNLQSSLVFDA